MARLGWTLALDLWFQRSKTTGCLVGFSGPFLDPFGLLQQVLLTREPAASCGFSCSPFPAALADTANARQTLGSR